MPQASRPLLADHGWPRQSAEGAAWPAAAGGTLPDELAEWLAQLLDALPGGVLVIDAAGVIRCCNAVASAMLGGVLVGRSWAEVTHRLEARIATDGGGLELRDGRHLRLHRRPWRTESGQVLLLTEVTARQLQCEHIDREQRLAALGEMVAGLAHQIRTPLATALLLVSQLADPTLAAGPRFAAQALERLRHLEGVIDDMLGWARGFAIAAREVPVQGLIDDLAAALSAELETAGGTLTVHNRVPGASVEGSRELLSSALLNLATNALQACADTAPRLRLEVVGRESAVELILEDDGPGIPAALRERVFTPFFSTRPAGSGLGLPMARRIAQAHGGDVRLHPSARGTRIGLCLPQCARPLASGGRGGVNHRPERGAATHG